jgi:hypothetical protein
VNDTAQDEITGYVAQVRLALGGVPGTTREELLDDLPEHLAEVLAEGNGSLVERLGSPSAYAAELLAAAGLGAEPPARRDQVTELQEWAVKARRRSAVWLGAADVRVGPILGYAKASDFLVLLRPAWWVLRGYLVAMVVAQILDSGSEPIGLLPRIGGSDLVALILAAAGIVGSIWFGRRGTPVTFWPRYAYYSGTLVLIILALAGFAGADDDARTRPYVDATYSGGSGYDNVRDVFVFDGQGRPVEDAQLYDQNGSPIQLGSQYCNDEENGESWTSWHRGYPRCPESNPFRSPSPSDDAEPTVSPSAAPSPSLPSPAPSVSPSLPASAPTPSAAPSR